MREIGGYIELETYHLPMLHENAIALNCGRNCLAYLIKCRGIKKLKVPFFLCDSITKICDRECVKKEFYHIGQDFKPLVDNLVLADDEWLYLVNFYGQLRNDEIKKYVERFVRVIVDQANGYYVAPLPGVDTFYTCRKWFGVADGAFLYTDSCLSDEFPIDESYDRMRFLLGRYERPASEFYNEYVANNRLFMDQPIKRMSQLTLNLLHAIDYQHVLERRRENFEYLHQQLRSVNLLDLHLADFMYPLMVQKGAKLRNKLQDHKIYIPMLWPAVLKVAKPNDLEYKMAENILPLPIDQRYGIDDMKYLVRTIQELQED